MLTEPLAMGGLSPKFFANNFPIIFDDSGNEPSGLIAADGGFGDLFRTLLFDGGNEKCLGRENWLAWA